MAIKIDVKNLPIGSKIAEPVINRYKQVILNKGVVIEKKHVALLKTWNIKTVIIEGEENELADAQEKNAALALAREKFAKKLNWTPQNEFEKELFNIGVIETYRKMSNKN